MESKKRFKLYKSGKLWLCASIAFAALTLGTTTTAVAHADTTNPVTTAEVSSSATANSNSSANTLSSAASQSSQAPADNSKTQVPVDTTTQNNDQNANKGNLDSYSVSTDQQTGQSTLHVSGWQATGQSNNERNRFVIVYDNTVNHEIARQAVEPQSRTDVQQAYPNIDNSANSGFDTTFNLSNDVLTHSLSVVSRYCDAANGEGNHTDYWFGPLNIDTANRASLDGLYTDEKGVLHVTGWHASNAAAGKKYHYIIAYDQTQNREIARKLSQDVQRNDVAKVYPTITDAAYSGFDVTFDLTQQYANDNIQFISRWTDDPAGNGNAVDYWFPAVTKQNRGNLDSWNLSEGNLTVSGWHANDASIYEPNHYLIVYDNTDNRQVASAKVDTTDSADVAKVYGGDTRTADHSRFSYNFGLLNLTAGHSYSLVSRYSTSATGNGNDGVKTDYWYPAQTLNQQGYSIDSWSTDGRKLTVNGWFANDQALGRPNAFVILWDGSEIARQKVTLTSRDDVANVYPGMYNSGKSGFTATFELPDNVSGNLQLVLRFSNQDDGEGSKADIWTGTYVSNAGNFDNVSINGNNLSVSGWHAAINTFNKPYQYIIAVDGATGNELNRWNITDNGQSGISRPDVQKVYPWIYNSATSGFQLNASGINADNYMFFKIIHRYTDDPAGNGNYVDYEQTIDRTNYAQRLISAWSSIINSHQSRVSIAVKSQLTGQTYTYTNAPGYHWWTASTVKVSVLSELLHRTGGNLDGTMQSLATRMIRYSDNDATTAIVNNYLGGVNGLYGVFNAENMSNTYTTPNGWGTTSTTAADVVKLLNDLYLDQNSGYLNQASRDYVHYQMSHVSYGQDWGISAGTGRGSFYIKNGWIPADGIVNSIGFIPSADNHHGYAIAVYTDNDPSFQYGINLIEQLARATKNILQ